MTHASHELMSPKSDNSLLDPSRSQKNLFAFQRKQDKEDERRLAAGCRAPKSLTRCLTELLSASFSWSLSELKRSRHHLKLLGDPNSHVSSPPGGG